MDVCNKAACNGSSTLTACANSRPHCLLLARAALTAISVSRGERIVTHGVICGHVTPVAIHCDAV